MIFLILSVVKRLMSPADIYSRYGAFFSLIYFFCTFWLVVSKLSIWRLYVYIYHIRQCKQRNSKWNSGGGIRNHRLIVVCFTIKLSAIKDNQNKRFKWNTNASCPSHWTPLRLKYSANCKEWENIRKWLNCLCMYSNIELPFQIPMETAQ